MPFITEAVTVHITTYKIQMAYVFLVNRQHTGYGPAPSNGFEARRRLKSVANVADPEYCGSLDLRKAASAVDV